MRIDLHDLSYLAQGTPRQRDALRVIKESRLWECLAPYTPALAGTVPLGIDTERSDLDIICEAPDPDAFERHVTELAPRVAGLHIGRHEARRGPDSVVAWFRLDGWAVEVWAQPVPVARQDACLHLLAEARLLQLGGKVACDAIREMKRQGLPTEPAFAAHFGIAGDPYEVLAGLAAASDEELRAVVK